MVKHLHIVSFDVPFPPDYGGVIDVYNRAKALKNAGIKITLHCFEYGRGLNHDFSEIADDIFYYPRASFRQSIWQKLPHIVASRNSIELLKNLQKDADPILLEGQHCSFWANELVVSGRKVLIRAHNVEWMYYAELAKRTKNQIKKWYYQRESKLLQKQEKTLKSVPFACISKEDQSVFLKQGFNAHLLPVTLLELEQFDANQQPKFKEPFALFHGNLSVSENSEAVLAICNENSRSKFPVNVVIAGKNPSKELVKQIQDAGFKLIANPDQKTMNQLIRRAAIQLLIGFQVSGVKIKVLNGIQSGRPCVATQEIMTGTGLETFVEIWDRSFPLAELISNCFKKKSREREEIIRQLYNRHGEKKTVEILLNKFLM